jgi:hypothetical protein
VAPAAESPPRADEERSQAANHNADTVTRHQRSRLPHIVR